MSTKEVYAAATGGAQPKGLRFVVILTVCVVALFALAVGAIYAGMQRGLRTAARTESAAGPEREAAAAPSSETYKWKIAGALTEACTCSVPCTCNFGEGPSPHSYCYPFYSYEIRDGNYGDVRLDGLHFGATDLKGGRTIFLDNRADERQRAALRIIAMRVIVRAPAEDAEAKAKEYETSTRVVGITQEYGERSNRLKVEGVGEFAADYVMGMDKSKPVVVRNNTTWRIHDTIKARTTLYRVQLGRDRIDVKGTNSNQGEFEYTDRTDFGAPAKWNCGACANEKAQGSTREPMCGQ